MTTWQQACSDARETLKSTASLLLDKHCIELFSINDSLSHLADQADEKNAFSVACGLYAASYRLAGSVKMIADSAWMVLSVVDRHSVNQATGASVGDSLKFRFMTSSSSYQPLLEKLQDYQFAVQDFAKLLQNDCHNELMHLTSELQLLMEHPFVATDDAFQSSLREQLDRIGAYMEMYFELGSELEGHPVLKIDAAMFDGAMHCRLRLKQSLYRALLLARRSMTKAGTVSKTVMKSKQLVTF